MSSVLIPLLRSVGALWFLLVGALTASVLTLLVDIMDGDDRGWSWVVFSFWFAVAVGGLVGVALGRASRSARTAILPNVAKRLRIDLSLGLGLYVLTVMLACRALGWLEMTCDPITNGVLACLGLALGLGVLDPIGWTRWILMVFGLEMFVAIFAQTDGRVLSWMEPYTALAFVPAGGLLLYSVSRWCRADLLRRRPYQVRAPFSVAINVEPHERPQPPVGTRLFPERIFRPQGRVRGLRRWRDVSRYESFGRLRFGRSHALILPTLATLTVGLLSMVLDDSRDQIIGFAVIFGLLASFFFGGALAEGSRLQRAILYPISRRDRARLAYTDAASHLGIVLMSGFAVACLTALAVSYFRQWDWSAEAQLYAFAILAVAAPIIQWPAVTGRNVQLGFGITFDLDQLVIRAVCLLMLAACFFFLRPLVSTGWMVLLSLALMALSQGFFFAALRQHFATTDLVAARTP